MRRPCASGFICGSALAVLVLLCGGCATRVTPPAQLRDPVTVYVVDYGRHSSIILPTGGPRMMEYTYGDWEMYANNHYRWYSGWIKLLISEKGALGRRAIEYTDNEQWMRMRIWAKRLMKVEVERAKAAELLLDLERAYDRRIATMIVNVPIETHFVRHDSRYWLMHTCNQVTADWLRKLGCEVRGAAILSNFRIEPPAKTIVAEPERGGPRS